MRLEVIVTNVYIKLNLFITHNQDSLNELNVIMIWNMEYIHAASKRTELI